MGNKPQTSREYMKVLNIIYFAILFVQILFAGILYINRLSDDGVIFETSLIIILVIVTTTMVLWGIFGGQMIYNMQCKKLKLFTNFENKLTNYRQPFIIRLAVPEGAALFAFVFYSLTQDFIFLALGVISIGYFLTLIPNKDKIAADIGLNPNEKARLDNPDEVIVN